MDDDARYKALRARDARQDGRFFTGVLSTGIYCRPICPARTPARRRVRFFQTAAAAEHAGFRACRRCRPDTAPGSPAWLGTETTVRRALGLIDDGALDGGGVEELAASVGLGPRQLRRLFREHLGVTPSQVAQTRRAHFARQLLGRGLPMSAVAHASGFGSVRRFNEVMRRAFGAPPSDLARAQGVRPARITLRLPAPSPYDFGELLRFMHGRALLGVERITIDEERGVGCYARTARFGSDTGRIQVRGALHDPRALDVSLDAALVPHALPLLTRLRRLFDTLGDGATIEAHLRRFDRLRPLIESAPGLRVPGAFDGFEVAVRAVLGQQVSVQAATTLAGRVITAFGEPLPDPNDDAPSTLFPSAATLAEAPLETHGVITRRADTIRELARRCVARPDWLSPAGHPGGGAGLRVELLDIKGIGPWTADYVALRALGDADAFPAGDLVLRKALSNDDTPVNARDADAIAEAWRPYRAYAALHLWADYGRRKG